MMLWGNWLVLGARRASEAKAIVAEDGVQYIRHRADPPVMGLIKTQDVDGPESNMGAVRLQLWDLCCTAIRLFKV
jgi:hypothetical protein